MPEEQRVFDATPSQTIVADRVGNEVMVGEHQMKKVVDAVVEYDIDVTNRFARTRGF